VNQPIQSWYAAAIQMPTEILWPHPAAEVPAVIAANIATATAAVREAVASDPKPSLILLPEYAFTGQPNGGTVAGWLEKGCAPVPGPLTAHFGNLARELGVYIGGNQFESDPEWPDRFFNTSWLVDPEGEVILRYRRVHTAMWCSPHDVWDDYLARYGGLDAVWPVVDTPLGRIAMVPCGEIAVPETVRTVALRGAEVLLHCTWETRSPGQDAAKIVAAAGNGMYVISTNVSGSFHDGAVDNRPSGDEVGSGSQIIAPSGVQLAVENDHVPAILKAEIDVEAVRALRSTLSMANPLLRLRMETIAATYQGTLYPPNAFLDLPLREYSQIERPAAVARTRLDGMATTTSVGGVSAQVGGGHR
jgi:predicted amidohydrolase